MRLVGLTKFPQQQIQAVAFGKNGKYDECIKRAKNNLRDQSLFRDSQIKNSVLIATISEDWCLAEQRRRQAEHIWCVKSSHHVCGSLSAEELLRYVASRWTYLDADANQGLQKLLEGKSTSKQGLRTRLVESLRCGRAQARAR